MTIEYGARLPISKVVYMTSKSLDTIDAWITDYSTVTPLERVSRECVGDTHGHWT